ncbi:hypothetical protein GCM10010346_07980 [Streptomyces chryseus]|uniref:Uncharacterized protein n=1 Tax=Streptomyces chryseus TaxID=68186 RepID=A0ABQ3DEM9_9ACTN|nr:hypothetical protein GCM10010346_07980 [Streptomyces chryseus]
MPKAEHAPHPQKRKEKGKPRQGPVQRKPCPSPYPGREPNPVRVAELPYERPPARKERAPKEFARKEPARESPARRPPVGVRAVVTRRVPPRGGATPPRQWPRERGDAGAARPGRREPGRRRPGRRRPGRVPGHWSRNVSVSVVEEPCHETLGTSARPR